MLYYRPTFLLGIIINTHTALAFTLQGLPQINTIIHDKMQQWGIGTSVYWPDGKILAFKSDPQNSSSPFIMNITPDFRMTSMTGLINDSTIAPAGADFSKYPNRIDSCPNCYWTNFVQLAANQSYPGTNTTGLREPGTWYDSNSVWLFNAYRLSETSQPKTALNTSMMIGFVHNEDYWADTNKPKNISCTYKSIGVRYSSDLGLSWTRSVPIVTAGIQSKTCDNTTEPFSGTGDFASMWDPIHSRWVIIAQEGWLSDQKRFVMSMSNDPLARPGTWIKINPVTGLNSSGYIGIKSSSLAHTDLFNSPGANPSIIHDLQNNVWHMVWSIWGGTLGYSNTTDLVRWGPPVTIPLGVSSHAYYPTLMGDKGDLTTSFGNATLYFTGDWPADYTGNKTWKCLYSVGVDLGRKSTSRFDLDGGESMLEGQMIFTEEEL